MFVYLQSQNRSYRSELPARRVGRSVRSFEIFAIRDVPKDERSAIWSDGRVARQRSAKPCTAVRIRFRPHRNRVADSCNAVFVLYKYNMYFFRGMVAGRFRLAGYEVMDENYDFPLIPPYPFYYSLFVAVYFYRAALAEQNRFVG